MEEPEKPLLAFKPSGGIRIVKQHSGQAESKQWALLMILGVPTIIHSAVIPCVLLAHFIVPLRVLQTVINYSLITSLLDPFIYLRRTFHPQALWNLLITWRQTAFPCAQIHESCENAPEVKHKGVLVSTALGCGLIPASNACFCKPGLFKLSMV